MLYFSSQVKCYSLTIIYRETPSDQETLICILAVESQALPDD